VAVVVWGRGLESADAAAARATEVLQGYFGADRVEPLDPDPRDPLLAKQAGAPADARAAARLIAVSKPGATAGVNAILAANAIAGAAGEQVAARQRQQLIVVAIAAGAVLTLVAIALIALWVVRAELKANASAVDLMLQFGASRGRIARMAQGRGTIGIFAGVLLGLGLAAFVTAKWAYERPDEGFGLMLRGPDLSDISWTGEFALAAMVLGLLAAWLTAFGAIRRRR
jgi:hypothetical protein